jgi:hypothetical protein
LLFILGPHINKKNQKKNKRENTKNWKKKKYQWEEYVKTSGNLLKRGWGRSNIQDWKIWQCIFDWWIFCFYTICFSISSFNIEFINK